MKKTFLIAEVGQAHDGSLGILHSYIDALADSGVDAIKFQTHIAEAESSSKENFRVNFSYEDKTRYDYWDRMSFTLEEWGGIKDHCDKLGIEFLSSPFSIAAVNLLEQLGVKQYKIGSGEVSNYLMLEKIAATRKPIILSSGMSSYAEIEDAYNLISKKSPVSILQCTTMYPTQAKNIGLNVMLELKEKFDVPVGLSDHSGTIFPCLAATSLGASILEFHAVFDKRMFGPDSKSSLTIDEIKQLAQGVRFIETSLNNPIDKNDVLQHETNKVTFGKSLAVNTVMQIGDEISFDVLESKKPGDQGVPAKDYRNVIGKKLIKPLNKWDFLNYNDLE